MVRFVRRRVHLSLMVETTPRAATDLAAAVHAGLSAEPRSLPCRFFYDLEGSLLFEEICALPEYYLTRTEDRILSERAAEIAAAAAHCVEIAELGSGSARKTRRILEAFLARRPSLVYAPIDISEEMLVQTADTLTREYPRPRGDADRRGIRRGAGAAARAPERARG